MNQCTVRIEFKFAPNPAVRALWESRFSELGINCYQLLFYAGTKAFWTMTCDEEQQTILVLQGVKIICRV